MNIFKKTPWYVDFIILAVVILLFLWVFKMFVSNIVFVCAAILLGFIWLYQFSYTLLALWQKNKKGMTKGSN